MHVCPHGPRVFTDVGGNKVLISRFFAEKRRKFIRRADRAGVSAAGGSGSGSERRMGGGSGGESGGGSDGASGGEQVSWSQAV